MVRIEEKLFQRRTCKIRNEFDGGVVIYGSFVTESGLACPMLFIAPFIRNDRESVPFTTLVQKK